MRIIPVINCDDFQCVKVRFAKLNEFIAGAPKIVHIDIADGIYAVKPEWNDPRALEDFIFENNFNFKISAHFMARKPSIEIINWSALITKAAIPLDCGENIRELADFCRERDIFPYLSVPPLLSAEEALKYADYFSEFQILAVSPGPSGQKMLNGILEKIKFLRDKLPSAILEVDGGINPDTVPLLKSAGADVILSGSYIFNSADPKLAYQKLQSVLSKMENLTELKIQFIKEKASEIRIEIIKMLVAAGSGHSAGPLGMADIFATLYFHILQHDPKNPHLDTRDRLVLSNGHICPVQYAAMAIAGYFPVQELSSLRKLGSRLQGHPHRLALPGIEITSGPLGSGLGQAIGIAIAGKLDAQKWRVYCLLSDGEHNEGSHWEAVMCAAKMRINNLVTIVDRNHIQIDGYTEDIMPLEPLRDKYISFGWEVLEIDGHSINEIIAAANEARTIYEKPTVIIAHTTPGKGVSFMENDYVWHGKTPNEKEAKLAIQEISRKKYD